MAIQNFNITDTRTGSTIVLGALSYNDATKILTIDCTNSASIPAVPANGEAVILGLLGDLEIAAKNKLYNVDSPISQPLDFNNPDFTSTTNFQYATRQNAADSPTVSETQIIKAFSFVGWYKATPPTATSAVNDND